MSTSHISIHEHNSQQAAGLVMLSEVARGTEIAALSSPYVPRNDHPIVKERPSPEHFWCSDCDEWVHRRGFAKDASGRLKKRCKDCEDRQQRRWKLTAVYKRLGLPLPER